MRALVTGATGFVGGALARRLHSMGWEVTALGRNPDAGQRLAIEGIRFVRADLTDADAIHAACRDQQLVFHGGALSSPWGRPHNFYSSNVTGTENVITA